MASRNKSSASDKMPRYTRLRSSGQIDIVNQRPHWSPPTGLRPSRIVAGIRPLRIVCSDPQRMIPQDKRCGFFEDDAIRQIPR